MKYYILFVSFVLSLCMFAETVRVEKVIGECTLANITPEQAKACAVERAKQTALERAGVEQSVKATTTLMTEENSQGFSDAFTSFSSVEMRGGIVEYELFDLGVVKIYDTHVYRVAINATVKKYTNFPDPYFQINVSGLQRSYQNDKPITFSVTPMLPGYLKIFLFENTEQASLVYPNAYEVNRPFGGSEERFFPTNPIMEYAAEKKSGSRSEHNYLVFVYTKKDIPFLKEPTYENILSWIYAMEPDQRTVKFEDLIIY